jgi:hypothetical protein
LKDRVPYLEWAQDQQTKDQIINKVIEAWIKKEKTNPIYNIV